MTARSFGLLLIVGGCSAYGFMMAAFWKRTELFLRQLSEALESMRCELQYQAASLPELFRNTAARAGGLISSFFISLAEELEKQCHFDAASCVNAAVARLGYLPESVRGAFDLLGASLGSFDLEGQVMGLDSVCAYCKAQLKSMEVNREERLRSYRTLGVCMGIALAIIFV